MILLTALVILLTARVKALGKGRHLTALVILLTARVKALGKGRHLTALVILLTARVKATGLPHARAEAGRTVYQPHHAKIEKSASASRIDDRD